MIYIDNTGNLTVTNTTVPYEPLMLFISACSELVCTAKDLNLVNLTIYPFFSFNPNYAPLFDIKGYELPDMDLYIGYNYYDSNYTFPLPVDADDNKMYVWLYLGKERTFTYYDNTTNPATSVFRFYNRTITERW